MRLEDQDREEDEPAGEGGQEPMEVAARALRRTGDFRLEADAASAE